MSSFKKGYGRTIAQKLAAKVLLQGPMPKHIGIIMDGNRRYAKAAGLGSVTAGHKKGDEKVTEVVQMCMDLNIPELTVYSFSTENFKRTAKEVKELMNLMRERSETICSEIDDVNEMGIGLEITGDYERAPSAKLKMSFAKLMWSTKDNTKFKLNVAFAYTSQNEIVNGLNSILDGLRKEKLTVDDVNEKLLQDTFNLKGSNPVDIIVRTSGEERLSDFMMWQGSNAYLDFVHGVTWPEFNNWHLLRSIWQYQLQMLFYGLPANGKEEQVVLENREAGKNSCFLEEIRLSKWKAICEDAKGADARALQ